MFCSPNTKVVYYSRTPTSEWEEEDEDDQDADDEEDECSDEGTRDEGSILNEGSGVDDNIEEETTIPEDQQITDESKSSN